MNGVVDEAGRVAVRRAWSVATMAAASHVLAGSVALAADSAGADVMPSYVIPNIVALMMVAVVVAIACKRYRQG